LSHISSRIDTMPFYIENPCNTRVFALLGDEKSPVDYKNVRVSWRWFSKGYKRLQQLKKVTKSYKRLQRSKKVTKVTKGYKFGASLPSWIKPAVPH